MLFDPPPLPLSCTACSFTQLGGGQILWCVEKGVSITAPRRKVKYMRLFSWTIVLFAIQPFYEYALVTIALCWTFLLNEKSAG